MEEHNLGIHVRNTSPTDVAQITQLQKKIFSGMEPWSTENLLKHIAIFPEGQWVAEDESGRIVGSASSLIIDWDDYSESARWSEITGNGTFSTHNPLGKTLYGADIGIDPDVQRKGVGTLLYEYRKKLVRDRGLKRILTGGRIPGYAHISGDLTPREYVAEIVSGKRVDPTLSFQLKSGFVLLDIIPEYINDRESHGFATLLEWLNPEYSTLVSFPHKVGSHINPEAESLDKRPFGQRRVRIAAIQYQLRVIDSFKDFANQVEFFVTSAKEYKSNFVMFPEYFTMQLLSYLNEPAAGRAVRLLAEFTPQYTDLFKRLSMENDIYIIAGTQPIVHEGKLFNASHLFTPAGDVQWQKKVHLTSFEKGPFQMSRGHGFCVCHTTFGKVAMLVCYDIEFPAAARVLAEAGVEIIFVPSCTDDRQGFCRVRYCSQARAIENQIYVAVTGTVGNLPKVPYMSINYSQAAIFTPSDFSFARDGIAAEAVINQEQMIITDVDLDLLDERRVKGSVVPINDMISDAYDRVIHFKASSSAQKKKSA